MHTCRCIVPLPIDVCVCLHIEGVCVCVFVDNVCQVPVMSLCVCIIASCTLCVRVYIVCICTILYVYVGIESMHVTDHTKTE